MGDKSVNFEDGGKTGTITMRKVQTNQETRLDTMQNQIRRTAGRGKQVGKLGPTSSLRHARIP